MDRNSLDDFSEAILRLLGERPENGVEIIPAPKVIEAEYGQVRLEVNGDGGHD